MKKIKLVMSIAALVAFAALPVRAQHVGGHGKSSSSSSMHGSSSGKAGSGKADKGSSSSIGDKLEDNTKLAAKLQGLLPKGTDLTAASSGFKNLGQFVAAVHVSHNLGISFTDLKNKMMGPPKESLGKAIHALRPDADSKSETSKATKQAKQDMDDSKSS
jgi:hypothetical protein